MTCVPREDQISLGICPVWSEPSLSAWRRSGSLATHKAHSKDSDQMTRLICVFAGRTGQFVGFVVLLIAFKKKKNEPPHDKTNKMACAPSEDSDQPGHLPSLIKDFAVRMKKALVLSYPLSAQRRLWSGWADAQADLSLRWTHKPLCWFCHEVAQITMNHTGLLHQFTVQILIVHTF